MTYCYHTTNRAYTIFFQNESSAAPTAEQPKVLYGKVHFDKTKNRLRGFTNVVCVVPTPKNAITKSGIKLWESQALSHVTPTPSDWARTNEWIFRLSLLKDLKKYANI